MAKKRPIILAVASDQHCGSTLGLCPPEKIGLPDGGFYEPSPVQKKIWSYWEDYWQAVRDVRAARDADLYVVLNGDLFEGHHHGTTQILSGNPEVQQYIAGRAFGGNKKFGSPVQKAEPTRLFVVRGTEAHVGPSGASEESFAKNIGATPDEQSTTRPVWSWWRLQLELHGRLVDVQHHPGTSGKLPWTRPQGASRLAFLIYSEHVLAGRRAPDLAFRGHVHNHVDSFGAYPTRAIITASWQLKTGHAHKVVPETLSDLGGTYAVIEPDGSYQVVDKLYSHYEVTPWAAR